MQNGSAPAAVRWNENKIIAAFRSAGAVASTAAKTPASVGVLGGPLFHKLRRLHVLREVATGVYYLDEERWEAVRKQRRIVLVATLIVVVVVVVLALSVEK
jgi:hypothetical protein